jgi:glutamate N-acetyltransferase / amino-acid N-acetyltransferase
MPLKLHEPPLLPPGFLCAARNCGLKRSGEDLSLFAADRPCAAAGLFTRNHFPGAPILLGRERLRGGRLQAVVVNSKVSNVATGTAGVEDARRMGRAAAQELGIPEGLVLVGSTGVIGRRLPVERIEAGLSGMKEDLQPDPMPGARGIMTTDRVPKAFSVEVDGAVVSVIGKGAGMIAPNLATMLVYFFTDAEVGPSELDGILREAAADTFQTLSVDTDTSTSDMVVALASGSAGPRRRLGEAFAYLSRTMAEAVARDGEGATKLLRVRVKGAADRGEAVTVARAVVDSPLIKTMAFGADPNVGRILMAVGKCVDCDIRPERVRAWLQDVPVVNAGQVAAFPEEELRSRLRGDPVEIRVELGVGDGEATALGCDLTEGYVEENAAYASS